MTLARRLQYPGRFTGLVNWLPSPSSVPSSSMTKSGVSITSESVMVLGLIAASAETVNVRPRLGLVRMYCPVSRWV